MVYKFIKSSHNEKHLPVESPLGYCYQCKGIPMNYATCFHSRLKVLSEDYCQLIK